MNIIKTLIVKNKNDTRESIELVDTHENR